MVFRARGYRLTRLITASDRFKAWMPALMHLDDDFFVTLGDSEEVSGYPKSREGMDVGPGWDVCVEMP